MGQALYRKYRSKSLSEIVGQDHITQTLEQALKQGRVSHAYLFTGPRGVGKTSIARILAHEINDLEYTDDSTHLDIIEIDAASNRRIDEIRELRDKVYIAPTTAKYKVYIIDEVHMLTREAFNALLKTLEEPPEHAIFILATTDAHKLPGTIVSRTQRFNFKPVARDEVRDHLRLIAEQEQIEATDEALELLAEHGEGSFRDSISMLDQASSHGTKLNADGVRQLLGVPPVSSIKHLLSSLTAATSAELFQEVTALYDSGFQASAIAKQLSQHIRAQIMSGQLSIDPDQAFGLLHRLLDVAQAHDPERYLEIVLMEQRNARSVPQSSEARVQEAPVKATKKPEPVTQPPSELTDSITVPDKSSLQTQQAGVGQDHSRITQNNWSSVVQLLKQRHNTLYGVIRMAEADLKDDGTINLVFSFAFHQKRMNEANNQQALSAILEEVAGRAVTITCTLDTSEKRRLTTNEPSPPPPPPGQSDDLSAISNIFGGGELLES